MKKVCCDVFEYESDPVELIIADPPYGRIVSDAWDKDWEADDYIRLARKCESLLVDGGSALIWGGIGKPGDRVFLEFLSRAEGETGLTMRNLVTWAKKRAYGKSNDYLFVREECAWFVKGDLPRVFNVPLLDVERGYDGYNKKYPAKSKFKRRTNVWSDITEVMRGKKHKCEKPVRLAEVLIGTHSVPGDTVLDLFAGSGNVSVVAESMGRTAVAVEGDPETLEKIGS